ncbi:MAG TPA: PQQ-dependent sugar dehydrogenase [Candidatus Thermoplasmatota archaeon]|jgi:hypothetical protein|nr:PQQ-dependent sugar dehydrogenase [Candidatus Thermoplasmatota archaeon]
MAKGKVGVAVLVGLLAALPLAQALVLPGVTPITLQPVAAGFSLPLFVTNAGDLSMRLFVVEQTGKVKVMTAAGAVDPIPYLDISSKIRCCGEQGLLGLAFHPLFEVNGLLFVSYTRSDGLNVIEKLTVADPANGRPNPNGETLLAIPNPFSNHNGGWIGFGPDGYLYWAKGDGGAGGDPFNNAQNLNSLLGKMLRLDVDVAAGYGIPPTNPFAVAPLGRPEIWAYGLRNPWRPSFDRATGDLWIADVGQGAWEEVNVQPPQLPAVNYGWRLWEGNHVYNGGGGNLIQFPVAEYDHGLGCSVTGGYVVRGAPEAPLLQGQYIYGDFCSGRIWALAVPYRPPQPGIAPLTVWGLPRQLLDTTLLISSFGEDELGDVYVVNLGGGVSRIRTP